MKRIKIIIMVMAAVMMSGCSSKKSVIEFESTTSLESETDTSGEIESETVIYVHVCGSVKKPGVYSFSKESRVYEAIEAAGGATKNAKLELLNLALILKDGDKIYIPDIDDTDEPYSDVTGSNGIDVLVNINTASKDELMTLPGIGEAKALAIIGYREDNGSFSDVEDIMKVSGIKESAFSKIKDLICVK